MVFAIPPHDFKESWRIPEVECIVGMNLNTFVKHFIHHKTLLIPLHHLD